MNKEIIYTAKRQYETGQIGFVMALEQVYERARFEAQEALQQELDRLKKPWVKCSEMLPEIGKEVLVYNQYCNSPIQAYIRADGSWHGSFELLEWLHDKAIYNSKITGYDPEYWRELPEPPQQ